MKVNYTENQLKAINESGKNIIVSAGAGSGKTAVLTQRVITNLKKGIKINELLILTFTNAAAGEMKDRIRKKIYENDEITDNLDLIDSSYITTFDSFALSLVKKYNYLLNVSSNINIINDNVIKSKKKQIIENIFNEYYEIDNPLFNKLINDTCTKNDKTLQDNILNIINKIDLKLNKNEFLNSYMDNYLDKKNIANYVDEYLNLIKEKINDIESYLKILECTDFPDYYEKLYESFKPLLEAKDYSDIKDAIDKITIPRRPLNSDDIKDIKDNIEKNKNDLKTLTRFTSIKEIYSSFDISKEYVQIILDIIKKYYKLVDDYKYQNDLYEFNDIEKMAILLLEENPSVKEEIKNYYKEIMIDEYQDTNDVQEKFINLIENNNVYMVGDIKQSIYGFRNANPSIFKEKYERYSNNLYGIKIDLKENFRSREEVLNNINEIFNLIMDLTYGGAYYRETHQMVYGNKSYDLKNQNTSYDMEILDYTDKPSAEIESAIIGKDILNKINSGYKVFDNGILRNASYSDFCIIMDRGTDFDIYKKMFEYLKIPLCIYEDKKLTESSIVMLINNIIKFIINLNNQNSLDFKYSFVSIARSYLFEISDNEILKVINNKNYSDTDVYKIAKEISLNINTYNIYEILNVIIKKFNIYENLLKITDINDSIIKIDNLLSVANDLMKIGYTLEDFSLYLTDIIESDEDIRYKESTINNNAVKIMNIHKSKGLEYNICYYSGLYKDFNKDDIKPRFMFDNTYGIITPYFDDGIGTTILKDLVKEKYNVETISERIRLFYVALTRAKEKIIMVGNINELYITNKGNIVDNYLRNKYHNFLSIINSINGNLEKYIKSIDSKEYEDITQNYLYSSNKTLDNNKFTQKIEYKHIDIPNEVIENKHASKIVNKLLTINESKNMEYGTKMHEILERVDFKNIPKNHEYYDILNNFVNKLDINVNTKIYKEKEFIYEKDNIKYHGIIDLVLIDKDIKIIDYKLSNIDDDKYLNQLSIYYDYLKEMYDLDITLYLYSIKDNVLKQVSKA